jgi:hypothetical protein
MYKPARENKMKRQIKKFNTFNRRLQKLAKDIDEETKRLTKIKNIENNTDELDDIDLYWDNLDTLCEDVIRYSVCNPL